MIGNTFLCAVENFSQIGQLSFFIENFISLGKLGTVIAICGRDIVGLHGLIGTLHIDSIFCRYFWHIS